MKREREREEFRWHGTDEQVWRSGAGKGERASGDLCTSSYDGGNCL